MFNLKLRKMKKNVLRIFGLVSLLLVMVVNLNMSKSESDILLDKAIIQNTAFASDEGGFGPDINAPWEKVCHPRKHKCTWRFISSNGTCSSDSQC